MNIRVQLLEQVSEFLATELIAEKMEYVASLREQYKAEALEKSETKKPQADGISTDGGTDNEGATEQAAEETSVAQVSIRATDIEADSVFIDEGYGSLIINGVGSYFEKWENPDSVVMYL